MAFENLFGNIDFQGQNKMALAQQQQFAEMLGRGIQTAQTNRQLDMQERQMEQKRNEVNVSKVAENAILKQNMGIPLDAQEQAAIATMGQLAKDQVYFDPITQQQVIKPSPWRTLGRTQGIVPEVGASQIAPSIGGGQMAQRGEFPAYDKIQDDYVEPQNIPLQPISINDLGGMNQVQNVDNNLTDVVSAEGSDFLRYLEQPYTASGALANTPRGAMMEEESRQKIAESVATEQVKRKIQGTERFSDAQTTAANFANRMVNTSQIIEGLISENKESEKGMTGGLGITKRVLDILPLGEFGSSIGDAAVYAGATPEQQKYMNAAENWITANLRKESGAVIGADEMAKEYRKYFPVAGDSGALIEQKAILRKEAEKGMIGQSAGAYQEIFGIKGQAINKGNNSQSSQNGWSIRKK